MIKRTFSMMILITYLFLSVNLQYINSSDPLNFSLKQVGQISTGGDSFYAQVIDGIAFVSDMSYRGIKVINVSNPQSPVIIDSYLYDDPHGDAHLFDIVDDLLYFADYGDGLEVVDISDQTNLIRISSWTDGYNVDEVLINEDIAYVIGFEAGLRILNISNFSSIQQIGSYKVNNNNYASLNRIGDYLYIGEINETEEVTKIINVADPVNPCLVNELADFNFIFGLQVIGSIAYAAIVPVGITILDITDVAHPTVLGQFNDGGLNAGVEIIDDFLFTVDFDQKQLEVINITNSNSPTLVIESDGFTAPSDIVIEGNYAYIVDHVGGLRIIELWNLNIITNSNKISLPIIFFSSIILFSIRHILRKRR